MGILKGIIAGLFSVGKKPLILIFIIFILFLILTPIFTVVYYAQDLTSRESILNSNNKGVILEDRYGNPFFSFYQAKQSKFIPLSDIPTYVQEAAVASEDKNFYTEPGFSLTGIGRSILADVEQQQLAQGGSTITQQLVKAALLNSNKNFLRKYQELVLAYEIEHRYTKQQILEMYLNSVYFGEGAVGIENAAQAYFSKDANDLTLAESAMLIGILPAPSAYDPLSNPTAANHLKEIVLQKMESQGDITAAQQTQALAENITFNPQKEALNTDAPHFALMVRDELIQRYGEQNLETSGYVVKTTIDLSWQRYAEQIVAQDVANLKYNKATNGAAVVLDPKTGEIKALVGSVDWNNEQFGKVNMAITPRQPGSSFKPIIYSDALEEKLITPATPLDDKPVSFGDYTPMDYDRQFRGQVLVRRALANSLNIPAVEVMDKVGVQNGIAWAQKFGITTLDPNHDYGLPLVLGAAEVPLLQMTGVYATFANNGNYVPPTTIMQVQDKNGNIIYTHNPTSTQVVSPETSFLISSILSDNSARAEEFGGTLTISRTAAVKTGTTNDFKDALTLGYTPSLTVGVWVGNNDNTPMDNIAGSLGAAPIWRSLMNHFLLNTPVEKFTQPFDVDKELVCRSDGLLSHSDATQSAYFDYFLSGTAPTTYCDTPNPSGSPTPSISETPTPTPTLPPGVSPSPTIEQIFPSALPNP